MTSMLKTFLTLFALVGVLSACSSNQTTDEDLDSMEPTPTAVPEPTPTPDPFEGVTNVFYFEFDSSVLSADARSALTIYAEVLQENPESVRLEGHADERGSREYNMALGERRANAVRDFLILQGVDASLIETVSYGEERPASMGSNEAAWALNRRVELVM